jgi:hypothetical protein
LREKWPEKQGGIIVTKKKPKNQKKPSAKKAPSQPLRIPLPFEQAVEALMKVKPKATKKKEGH